MSIDIYESKKTKSTNKEGVRYEENKVIFQILDSAYRF